MISIRGLSYRFHGAGHHALRDVHLDVKPGEFLVVTGPSGSGKSTLALAIGGFLFRQFEGEAMGTVTVDGMDVRRSPIFDVAEVVGLVQQNPEAQFCTLTVRDEMAFGLENRRLPASEIRDRTEWALGIVDAQHLAHRSLATLSGGEKQKIAIAAMMASKPQVLIFDEPTSNLDPTSTAEIFRVIEHIQAKAGITVIVIEHKVGYLRPFRPRHVVMRAGRLVSDGPMSQAGSIAESTQPAPRATIGGPAVIDVDDLHAGYNGRAVLQGVSLKVQPGEFLAVMGNNGSGKTTFLRCLLGFVKPAKGRVVVLSQDTHDTPVSSLARQAGFVFQNPDHQLFADSVWEEATLAAQNFDLLDGAAKSRIAALLDRCGLGDRLDDHPYRLSYGQKRRLNLVSVLSYNPRLILLDEVLIGQDPENASFLLDLLAEHAANGGSVVMVNHAPRVTRRYATRVVFLNNGLKEVDGPTAEAFDLLQEHGWHAYVA